MIKQAEVVRLKSGGPCMTVVEVGTESAQCIWFDAAGHVQRYGFLVVLLDRVGYGHPYRETPLKETKEMMPNEMWDGRR